MIRPDSVIILPSNSKNMFEHWLRVLQPFHGLVEKELELAAEILRYRYSLSRGTDNEDLLDSAILYKEHRKKIISNIPKMSGEYFNVLLTKLRNKKFILNDRVNPKFIPKFKKEGEFNLLIHFDLNDSKGNN